ncbi:unnamed protein product [Adineta steineri]|uniref:RRM domain-containing protein n=2 Tax=Adineta steineri TaxID=433720 RepID=A0A813ZU07_9BILA|nr:unnamed protein product [Adineta steineri]CAF3666416.1 unnamed protein product [Adineta steineri]
MQIRTYTMSGPVKIVKTKLFIGNLDPSTQPEELNELCSPFGTVLEASVIKDYGFVHYGSIEEAEKAANALNNKDFHGKRLRVELSTSTVRHRPGQPEPASALRHSSRARTTARGNYNGVSRYHSGTSGGGGGGGPVRHTASSWARNESRPYSNIPLNHGTYDRSRPYDIRSDSRRYYDERRDNGYGTEYGEPAYLNISSGGQEGARHYRDLPAHIRADEYDPSRSYDRHLSTSAIDPYYSSGIPHEPPPPPPPAAIDPYQNYDPYQKHYASRPRDPGYPDQRDYDVYSNYRNGSYGITNSQGQFRHDLPVNLQQQQQQPPQGVYPPSHRQHHSYASGSSNLGQYYGAQQR